MPERIHNAEPLSPHPGAANAPDAVVRLRRERLLAQSFGRDPRASLPRPLRPVVSPAACLAGVPAELRSRIGHNLQSTAFPYPQFLQGDGDLAWTEIETIELTNARWQVVICPRLGGRIFRIFDRRAERELLLLPPVLQQGVVGLPGAWFIGGVEFNAFRYGHNVHGQCTIRSRLVRLPAGEVAVELGACDELFGCAWQVTVALGRTQVFLRVELRNLSDKPQPDYWWTTIAVPAHRDIRVMAAPGPVLHHGMFRLGYQTDVWPWLHGHDWSRWLEHHEIASSYWYDHGSDVFGSIDTADGFAFVHQADRAVCRGRKLWSIGAGRDNGIWSDRLLEPPLPSYLELQSGLYPTQVECGWLQPGERRAWTESLGASSLPRGEEPEPYAALFARFENTAGAAMRSEYSDKKHDRAWTTVPGAPLTEPEERLRMSERITVAPEEVTAKEAAALVEEGWVGGDRWIRKLEHLLATGELTARGNLALAAARLDHGDTKDALTQLETLAAGLDATAGWAAFLLGLHGPSERWLHRATTLLAERGDVWLALDAVLARQQKDAERRDLWSRAPTMVLRRDDVRVARAAGALARGEWPEARSLLTAQLPTIAEGSPTPWLLYRETFVGEAAAHWRRGETEPAAGLLFFAGQAVPQFGIGRDEAGWSGDLLYYRWRLATDANRGLEASLLVAAALAARPYVGSVSAAYLARLLHESGHGAAVQRLEALHRWDADAGEAAAMLEPIRTAVLEPLKTGGTSRWQKLINDPLYRHRATLELHLLHQRAGAENAPPNPCSTR